MTETGGNGLDPDDIVLVVDDEEGIRENIAEALEDVGYTVRTAANGAEAIKVLEEGIVPCLIILDLWMPVMDGWKFIEHLRDNIDTANVPVFIITAADAIRNVGMGEVGLIRKPFQIEALLRMCSKFCSVLFACSVLAASACGAATPKVVAITTVSATCEDIEQRIEDQNPCSTDLETVQGELACTRRVCGELVHRLETSGGE